MPDPTPTHWTADEELLERFVAGRIPAIQREALEVHLKMCDLCQARVSDEQLMSAGINAAGRVELRRELSDRIARRTSPGTIGVWRWMAAAAVLVAVVGVWRLITPETPAPDVPPVFVEKPAAATAEASQPVPDSPSPAPTSERSHRERRADRTELSELPEAIRPAPAPAAGAAAPMAGAPAEHAADALVEAEGDKSMPAATPQEADIPEVWVEATILRPAIPNAQKKAPSPAQDRLKDARSGMQATGHVAGATGPMPVQLRQTPQSALPVARRSQITAANAEAVPVRLMLMGDSLSIELFPPVLFAEADVQKALILRPAADSVIVLIGHQLLGLRIPEAFRAH